MADRKRLPEMDILRGMAILMVLLYHSIIVFPVNLHEIQWCSSLHTFLWVVQMPLFFLVSGFCYSGLYGAGYGTYLGKKCSRILVPHIVFSLLDILPRIIPNPLVNEQMEWREALKDFAVYGGSDWFLWTLFVIAALFPLLLWALDRGRWGRMAVLFFAVLMFVLKEQMPDEFLLNMVSQYLLYYTAGWLLRQWRETRTAQAEAGSGQAQAEAGSGQAQAETGAGNPKMGMTRRNSVLCAAALPGIVLFFAGFLRWEHNRYLELACVICSSLFFGGISCLLAAKETGGTSCTPAGKETGGTSCTPAGKGTGAVVRGFKGFLTDCGTWSLQMYLLDAYALVVTRTLLVSVLGIQNPAVVILGNFIADTLIVLAVSKYILTKVKVFRILCGIPEKKTNAV